MTDIKGKCSSRVQSQTMVSVEGSPNHQVGLMVMHGRHSSPDQKWDGAMMTYVGTSDIVDGNGQQRGYFYNAHPNGDTSHGKFEAQVSGVDGVMTVEGTWQLLAGTGTLAALKAGGGGSFKAHMTSPTDSEMSWVGKYELG